MYIKEVSTGLIKRLKVIIKDKNHNILIGHTTKIASLNIV